MREICGNAGVVFIRNGGMVVWGEDSSDGMDLSELEIAIIIFGSLGGIFGLNGTVFVRNNLTCAMRRGDQCNNWRIQSAKSITN